MSDGSSEATSRPAAIPRKPRAPAGRTRPLGSSLPAIGLLIACVAYLGATLLTYNQIEEDAFIYFRVADHLAGGYGYVFNPGGDPIETGSSPLWQLLLTGLAAAGIDLITGAKLLGIGFGVGALVMLSRIARLVLTSPVLMAATPIAFGLNVPFVMWSQRGLESALWIFLLLWLAFARIQSRESRHWVLPAAMLLLARPEAPLILASLLVPLPRPEERAGWLRMVLVLALVLTALTAGRVLYFHDFVSHPFYPKLGVSSFRWASVEKFLSMSGWPWLLAPVALASLRPRFFNRATGVLLSSFALLTLWGVSNFEIKAYFRHLLPALPFLALLFASAIDHISAWLPRARSMLAVAAAATLVAIVGFAPSVPRGLGEPAVRNPIIACAAAFASDPARYTTAISAKIRDSDAYTALDEPLASAPLFPESIGYNYQALVGKFVGQNLPTGTKIVYDQMGQTPYYAGSDMVFIDSDGLTDRAIGHAQFVMRSQRSLPVRIYTRLLAWANPSSAPILEQRNTAGRWMLGYVSAEDPHVLMLNRFASRGAVFLRMYGPFIEQFEPRWTMGRVGFIPDIVLVLTREEPSRPSAGIPHGLLVRDAVADRRLFRLFGLAPRPAVTRVRAVEGEGGDSAERQLPAPPSADTVE